MSKALIAVLVAGVLATGLLMMGGVQQDTVMQTSFKPTVHTFQEYLAEIAEQINADPTSTWKATNYARWSQYDFESIKRMNGALQLTEDQLASPEYAVPVVSKVSNNIPTSFSAQQQWPNCSSISEIRDQANCGSCWAFGAGEAITDRVCIASNQTSNNRISMDNILTCCGTCGYGCGGGYPIQAWRYWVSTGVVTGDGYGNYQWCQPYFLPSCGLSCPSQEATAPACSKQCNSNYTGQPYNQVLNHGKSAYAVAANVAAIQTEIMTNGPVEGTFSVYADFYQYQSGVYVHKTGQYLGGHAIKIVGWGVSPQGQEYWEVANSWSSQWGMSGFFQILRGVNECGIEQGVVAGLAQ